MRNLLEMIKITIFSPFGLIVSFLIVVGYTLYYEGIENEKEALHFVNETEYKGIIINKLLTSTKKGGEIIFVNFVAKDTVNYFHNLYGGLHKGLFEYIQIGDTILKSKGEGRIIVKKTNGKEKEFKYNSTLFPNGD